MRDQWECVIVILCFQACLNDYGGCEIDFCKGYLSLNPLSSVCADVCAECLCMYMCERV